MLECCLGVINHGQTVLELLAGIMYHPRCLLSRYPKLGQAGTRLRSILVKMLDIPEGFGIKYGVFLRRTSIGLFEMMEFS